MIEDKDVFVIWCSMKDISYQKQDYIAYAATPIEDLEAHDKKFVILGLLKILQSLSNSVNNKVRKDPNFLVSYMEAKIIKESELRNLGK